MRKKKIVLLCAAILIFAPIVMSQTQSTFGIRAGVNFQNINGKDVDGDDLENNITTGFHGGVNVEIPVGIDFYIQPGLLFSTKGAELNNSDDKISLSYLEIPINLLYKPALGQGKLLLGFGPYLAYAIGGKYKPASGSDEDIEFQGTVGLADPPGFYARRFDAGANLLFGYELANNLSLQLNAQLGLVKINPEYEIIPNDETSMKNTGFGVSVGYRF